MASIAMTSGSAVLNAAAFTGSNYLEKYWFSESGKAVLEKKTWNDTALDVYQAAMAKYTCGHSKLCDWIETNREIKEQVKQDLTNQAHLDLQIYTAQRTPLRCRNKVSYFLP